MHSSLRRSFTVVAALMLGTVSTIALAQHDGHQHAQHNEAAEKSKKPVGDPYPLNLDIVTGEELPGLDEQIIIKHDGRELRFSSKDSVDVFTGDPDRYLAAIDELIVKQQLPYYPLDTCIISGDKLGGDMGDPINFVYKNRLVRFCCPGCSGDFSDNAAAYLKVLDEAVIAQQTDEYPLETCPVSGGKLGSMGDPIDVVIANRQVRLCCKGCIKKLRAEPVKYLGELGWKDGEHDGHEIEAGHTADESGDSHSTHNRSGESGGHGHSDHGHSGH